MLAASPPSPLFAQLAPRPPAPPRPAPRRSDPLNASFTVTRDLGLADLDTVVCSPTVAHPAPGPFVQEVAMFDAFAAAAAAATKTAPAGEAVGSAASFWPEVLLQTQAVLEAVLESDANGGVRVPVPQPQCGSVNSI